MKKTLRLVGVAAMVLLLAASCKKEEKNNGEKQMMTFSAGIEQTGAKTGLQSGDEAHAFKQVWTEKDQINVNGTSLTVSINPDDNTQGTFTGEVIATGKYYAVYPTSAMLSGSTAKFTLPQTQNYVANSYESDLAPMAAYTENNELNFKNLCGLMELSLKGDGITVTSLELSCDKPIYGTATYNIGGSEPLAMLNDASKTITMNCGDGVVLEGNAKSFVFVLPPVTNGNFSLKVSYKDAYYSFEKKMPLPNGISVTASEVVFNNDAYEIIGAGGEVVTTEVVKSSITSNSADVKYTVTPNGVSQATEHGVCYGIETEPDLTNKVTVTTGSSPYTASITGLTPNTKYYVRAYAVFEPATKDGSKLLVYGNELEFSTKVGSSVPAGFVDFGTTADNGKKLYWAKYNLGASDANLIGGYYSWGEVSTKTDYSWGYTSEDGYIYGWEYATERNLLIKYCNNDYYWGGSPNMMDNKTKLDNNDDAAYVASDGANRMPTASEFQRLLEKAFFLAVENYNGTGVKGIIAYVPKKQSDAGKFSKLQDGMSKDYTLDDEHVFFPIGGSKLDADGHIDTPWSQVGCYWVKDLYTDAPEFGRMVYFTMSKNISVYYLGRNRGQNIRPVCEGD